MKYSLRFHLHFDGKEIFGIIDWNRSGMIRNAILLLMNWISIHLQCVFMGFLLLFWRKSFVIQSFANGSLCSLHLIYFSINLCARFKSEYIQFENLSFKREKVDQTELTKLCIYVCQCVLYLIASLFVWMHRSGTYWWFPLVYSLGKWTNGLCAKKPLRRNNLIVYSLFICLFGHSKSIVVVFNGTMRNEHTSTHNSRQNTSFTSRYHKMLCS